MLTRKEAEALHAMDEVGRRLWFDLRCARLHLEALRRRVSRAERAVELRLREFADYKVTGIVPKRKSVADEAKRSVEHVMRQAGDRKGKGGAA